MTNENTLLKSYYYDLPDELIAQHPSEKREECRLLAYDNRERKAEHTKFFEIIHKLNAGDVLVVNNSKVLPSRLFGEKIETGAKIEILLLKKTALNEYTALSRPAKKLKEGTAIKFSESLSGKILEKGENGEVKIKFDCEGLFENELEKIGEMPLPPYIKARLEDKDRYNTVYSKVDGSAAAPTAGLHFSEELLEKIKAKGVKVVEVLLHVGLGTFRPVEAEDILDHHMHSEYIKISKESADIINEAKKAGGRVIAVGTTSVRVLESAAGENGELKETEKETNIFIYPPYQFKVVDGIITNFHLPESTLIMLVSAFIGREETMKLYNEAVREKYKFFSFGDAMFLI